MKRSTLGVFAIFGWAALCHGESQAQGSAPALEEVLVTAEKKEASLQDTPISLSAFNSEDIEKLGISNLADIQFSVPNMAMRQFPNSQSSLRVFIRGIGNNDVQITQDPAVGVYIDGVYVSRSSGLANKIVDPARIEVLRGPQGTLYGRNATGGAINIIPRAPSGDFGWKQSFTYGNYERREVKTDIDLPEIAGLSAKLGYVYSERDGWVENLGEGPDFGDERKQGARLALRYDLSDTVTVDYAYDYTDNDIGTFYYQTIGRPNAGFEDVTWSEDFIDAVKPRKPIDDSGLRVKGQSLIVNWDFSETLQLKSLTGYREMDEWIYQDYGANPNTDRLFANDPFETSHRQFSQEFQITGTAWDQQLSFVAGLYYFEEAGREFTTDFIALAAETFSGPLPLPISAFAEPVEEELQTRTTRAENEASAIFGQLTYSPVWLDNRWHFTLGLRKTEDTRYVNGDRQNGFWGVVFGGEDFESVETESEYSNTSPAFTVAWDARDHLNLYVKYVEGYRTGGYTGRGVSRQSLTTPIGEETVANTELGIKSEWFDRRVRFNAALFQSDYEDIQLSFATQGNPADVVVFNAGKASIKGLEADITAMLLHDLMLNLNYAVLDTEVEEVINPNTGANDAEGYSLPSAPDSSYTIDLTYTPYLWGTVSLLANINYSWRDSQWPAADSGVITDAEIADYGLLNARLGLRDLEAFGGTMAVSLWGKNLGDEEYQLDIIGAFPWSTRVGAFGEPRSYGVDLSLQF
ncbi:iron complex outermembrane receptor protein [Litorivivens lipolytica]|uniref:Iron complex outermembrane receptor protein n=1 Tax=Litorivivens lipolytica TaxID=1524264 RepID=A0A7W4W3Z1_9GAMM|nr:TonB-dependent receptor [Litorivivens lipolytica]MBB3046974.1 iron complex outermembrane receptor protein [Litorivivens lipolytica]